LVGRLVDVLTEELDVPTQGADPVTLKRIGLHKAVEPDRLFYFGANAARVQGNRELNLAVDPPPDLVIEVDVTASSVPRLPIFAALGIPEVWRIDEDARLVFLHLEPDGAYQPRDRSRAFPALLVAEAARFLEQGQAADMTAWIRTFRAYVRDVVVPRPE
jgi:Uma2 family endonuclease